MMRTAFGLSFVMALAIGAVGGCSSKDVKDDESSSAGDVCKTYCTELNACDSSRDLQVCQGTCGNKYDSSKLSGAFSNSAKTCLTEAECADYLGKDALTDCANKAVAVGEESAKGSAFCDDLAGKLTECELTGITATECSGRIRTYGDAAIAEAAACLSKACTAVVDCVNLALPPTSGSGTGATGGSGGSGSIPVGGSAVGGTTSTAGTGGGPACPVTCLDADTAQFCDATGAMMTANCAEEFAIDGLISNGCLSDATGDGCTLDGLSDADCDAGTAPFAFCAGLTSDDLLDVYVGCFRDMNGAHTVIPCYADFVMGTEEAPSIDCMAADAACLPAAN